MTTYWDLFDREIPLDPVDQLLGAPPQNAEIAELLEFTLQAADSAGVLITDFNAPGHLLSNPVGMVVVDDAGFADGEALCQIRFDTPGVYEVSLADAHPQIDGPIGSITVIERPVDRIEGSMADSASVGEAVEFSLQALDVDGTVVNTFNEAGALESDPEGMSILEDAVFTDGVANCSISFPTAGVYEVTLGGSHSEFNILLGSVT